MPPEPQAAAARFIYIACPWTPKGGGMFKVADYLIQTQSPVALAGHAQLRALDTRGGGSAAWSVLVLTGALLRLVLGRLSGRLAGVHVNMAERMSLFRKSVLILGCRALGLPVVLHLHAAQLQQFYRDLPRALQWLTRQVFARADLCVVLGQTSRRFVTETLRVPPRQVRVLINGVPRPTTPRRTPGPVQQVLFVGNLSERKGVSDLLRALARPGFDATRTQVRIVGGGEVLGYRRKAQALGLDPWVHFEGWADQARVSELMAQADVLVLPSHDEGLPLVILEALAHGVAVLCTPVGEIASFLQDGQQALWVAPGDVSALAAQLQRVLGDARLRAHLERQGHALYEAQFSMRRFFEGVAQIHQQVMGVCAALPAGAMAGAHRPPPTAANAAARVQEEAAT